MEQVLEVEHRQRKVVITTESHRLTLTRSLYRERPLEAGDTVEWDELEQWVLLRQYRHGLERAVAMLAARSHSTEEIRQKLIRAGYLPATADMVITKLDTEHLVDDEAFAQQWAETRARKKLGQRRIAMELRRKGIGREAAEDAVALVEDNDWLEGAKALIRQGRRKTKPGADPRKEKMRIFGMLARRGFPMDITKEAWDAVQQEASM